MTRLFLAAWPSDETIERLAAIDRPTEPGVRWVPSDNWHITLRFFGAAEVGEVVRRLEHERLPRAVARLGPTIEQLGARSLVIPVDGVDPLAASVLSATADIGQSDRRRFRAHLTIARLTPGAVPSVSGNEFEARFEIDEVALVASEPQPIGVVYRTVATFATSTIG